MRRLLLFTLFLLAGCGHATEHPLPLPEPVQENITDWGKLKLAIAMTESEFKADAESPEGDRGILQLRAVYVAEVNRLSGSQYTPEDAFDSAKSLAMFDTMQRYKNPSGDIEAAIRWHNKGEAYKRKVLANLAFIERYEAFRELIMEQ